MGSIGSTESELKTGGAGRAIWGRRAVPNRPVMLDMSGRVEDFRHLQIAGSLARSRHP
jgi:hypothetical protein